MYDIIKDLINSGNYELVDIKYKINKLWVSNDLTNEEMEELMSLAQDNADPENSYAPLQKQIEEVYKEITSLKGVIDGLDARVLAIEKGSPQEPVEPPVEEEYPEYKQPTGAHDAYNVGDKITFEGKKYECLINGCVWNPHD
ncbi:MAG: hypothetical protein ACLS7Y_06680, partial [Thomasclavelia spiroformis]